MNRFNKEKRYRLTEQQQKKIDYIYMKRNRVLGTEIRNWLQDQIDDYEKKNGLINVNQLDLFKK